MTSFVIGALVLVAGLFMAILVSRSASTNGKEPAGSARADGFRFFFAWFVVGGFVALLTLGMFMTAMIGGVSTPPGAWLIFQMLGMFVLPVMLALGGVPAAIKIAHGEPWRRTAWLALLVCVASWVVLAGAVFLGPSIFGWSW